MGFIFVKLFLSEDTSFQTEHSNIITVNLVQEQNNNVIPPKETPFQRRANRFYLPRTVDPSEGKKHKIGLVLEEIRLILEQRKENSINNLLHLLRKGKQDVT